jgi:transcriptional regulator GlxA family with amidase domain
MLLGAAGILQGKRATSHWAVRDSLRNFGAEPVAERVGGMVKSCGSPVRA